MLILLKQSNQSLEVFHIIENFVKTSVNTITNIWRSMPTSVCYQPTMESSITVINAYSTCLSSIKFGRVLSWSAVSIQAGSEGCKPDNVCVNNSLTTRTASGNTCSHHWIYQQQKSEGKTWLVIFVICHNELRNKAFKNCLDCPFQVKKSLSHFFLNCLRFPRSGFWTSVLTVFTGTAY